MRKIKLIGLLMLVMSLYSCNQVEVPIKNDPAIPKNTPAGTWAITTLYGENVTYSGTPVYVNEKSFFVTADGSNIKGLNNEIFYWNIDGQILKILDRKFVSLMPRSYIFEVGDAPLTENMPIRMKDWGRSLEEIEAPPLELPTPDVDG